jgi:hypothetical protein
MLCLLSCLLVHGTSHDLCFRVSEKKKILTNFLKTNIVLTKLITNLSLERSKCFDLLVFIVFSSKNEK